MKKIAIISPVFNEEMVINQFYDELSSTLNLMKDKYESEIIFVLDGCTDKSLEILDGLAALDKRIKILNLSRRYGHQNSIIAGMDHAQAEVVIMLDSDLQHPPALILDLISAYESGYEIVHAVRSFPENNNFLDRLLSKIFYKLLNLISDANAIPGAADFRLLSGRVNNIFRDNLKERDQFLRGLFIWIGFKQCSIPYLANKRSAGSTKYSLFRKIDFALTGLISFNLRPLKILTIFGFFLSFISLLFSIFICFAYFFNFQFPRGWSTLIVSICLIGGIQLFFLGVISQYLASIYKESKQRPLYLVDSKLHF